MGISFAAIIVAVTRYGQRWAADGEVHRERDLAVVITAGTRADKHRTSLVEATPERVESFNRDVAANAEMVISPSKSFPGVEAVADLLSAP